MIGAWDDAGAVANLREPLTSALEAERDLGVVEVSDRFEGGHRFSDPGGSVGRTKGGGPNGSTQNFETASKEDPGAAESRRAGLEVTQQGVREEVGQAVWGGVSRCYELALAEVEVEAALTGLLSESD